MSTAPEPTGSDAEHPRSRQITAAVERALATYLTGTGSDSMPRPSIKPINGSPPQAPAEPGDGRLAYLDQLMESPLGQAWLEDPELRPGAAAQPAGMPGVVAPLPRRKLIAREPTSRSVPSMLRQFDVSVGFFTVMARMLVWLWGYARYQGLVLWDSLRGKSTIRRRARHLRTTMERLGATFVKLGQQLSLRADILPYEYCEELGEMLDHVPPFPAKEAIAIIERSLGKKVEEVFQVFDPDPIGSASLACVYQALLPTGEKVAVKVRRPGIQRTLSADMKALGWLLQLAELLTLVRSGMTRNLRYELSSMLLEETDFRREARYTELFRSEAQKKRQRYLAAPKVYTDLSGDEMVVTEFVSGVFLSEVLGALDRKDEKAIEQLHLRGIDPKKIAENLVMAFNWETLENVLFHADPHPANIVVREDNTVAFIDFGSCGRFSARHKRLWRQFHGCLSNEDVSGMTEIALAMLEPLPPIDLESFKKEIEALYWDLLYAMKSDTAEWWEKASGVMWMKFIGLSRKYNVPVNLDTIKSLRVTFLFDTIIFRLWRDLDLSDEYQRYHRKAGKRARKRLQKTWARRAMLGPSNRDYMRVEDMLRMGEQVASQMQRFLDTPRHTFGMAIDKAYFVVVMILQVVAVALVLHVVFVLGLNAYGWFTGVSISFWDAFVKVVSHPLYQVLPLLIVVLLIRKVVARLADYDV